MRTLVIFAAAAALLIACGKREVGAATAADKVAEGASAEEPAAPDELAGGEAVEAAPSMPGAEPNAQPGAHGGMCGGIAAFQCAEASDYCAMEEGACLTNADAAGTCAAKPEACTMDYNPVCGCDGKTYGNACSAAGAGANVATSGECPKTE